ncbi:hypothetical protein KC318_g5720 [Hortaea werneckii]|uniref:Succinate dehydrogenase assembly factor 4, mitochondrial n=1 Tax=Hortaea werneckii TaxID=91943 RepID=A0A3M7BEV2_HORWE|nr:hypothetical protein KC334_g2643 [Hortaea werneckii]KAI7004942.1 hypothetical protein KC355_g8460 [Hortaea werneckii]KAI7667691.1 hypothetical protein KC318_g5720 [Hortaea werneckii]RMY22916.1 hypothetical protein D0867_02402 [Hortaea werneckii]RMY38291.1 hypothetical protein D0866_02698 [Hortaea werneckii]
MQTTTRAMRTMRPGFFRRTFTTRPAAQAGWGPQPSPPKLPKEEQEIFEKLQQQSTGAFSTPRAAEPSENAEGEAQTKSMSADDMLEQLRERARLAAKGDGEELHPNVRRGAAPEFEGDTNPKTGEVGGPKNEPLRWGNTGDWSYNGRVTDF